VAFDWNLLVLAMSPCRRYGGHSVVSQAAMEVEPEAEHRLSNAFPGGARPG
jgi:hypothetical protein